MRKNIRGEVRLTLGGKLLMLLVGVAVLGYAGYRWKTAQPVETASPTSPTSSETAAPTVTRAGVLEEIKKSGTVRVGMEPDAPPLHFLENGKENGFDYMLVKEIARRIGAPEVEVVEADYEELPNLLREGKIDLLMGGYVPDPSITGVEWSQGYLDFGLAMIVAENMASQYREPRDLARKTIAIYDDPAAERWVLDNIPNATIRKFSGEDGWFEAVESGQADALIYDYPFAAVEIADHPRTVISKYNLNRSKYAIGVPAGNYDLIYAINQAIEEIKGQPMYAELMRKYLTTTSEIFTKPVAGQKSYTVKAGDTLSTIADRELGDMNRWQEIWELNKGRVADPNLIYPRLVLLMP